MKGVLFLLFTIAYCAVSAQDTFPHSGDILKRETDTTVYYKPRLLGAVKNVPEDLLQIVRIPFQKRNLTAVGLVAAGSALLIVADQTIIKRVRHISDQIGLDPATRQHVIWKIGDTKIIKIPKNINTALYQIGEGGSSILLAGGLLLYGKIKKSARSLCTANDLVESFLTTGIVAQALKRVSGRESPYMATTSGGRWRPFPSLSTYQQHTSSYDAFPSGHLTTLMATVTVLAYNYPEKKWIRPLGYSIIGMSAWAMMNNEVHWAGDYPLAIGIGYLSGKITALKHRCTQRQRKENL